jgi:hypothetical protein
MITCDMRRGILSLLSVSGAELRLCPSNSGDVVVRFTVQVGQQQSGEQLALVEQVPAGELGLAGRLKVRCASIDVGIPPQVIEPYIETYVLRAVQMIGGVSLAEMANKVVEVELQVPIEFEVDTIH